MSKFYILAVISISFLFNIIHCISTEEINEQVRFNFIHQNLFQIPKDKGVFLLTEETFDDFINWNNLTFVCFHNKK